MFEQIDRGERTYPLDGRPSLSTSGETLTIEESMNLEGENGARRNVGDEHEWSWAGG
jgi:hypothetical protein